MNKIEVLQLLRAYGAITVFLSHFFGDYNFSFINLGGQLGVAVFFTISGYLLVINTRYEKLEGYFGKKVIRLIPLYWMLTCCIAIIGILKPELLHTSVVNELTFFKSLFLIPNTVEGTSYVQPILPVGWTLYLEVFVYILFFVCIKICKEHRRAGILASSCLIVLHIICSLFQFDNIVLKTYSNSVVLYFSVGMIVAVLNYNSNDNLRMKEMNYIVGIIGLVMFIIAEQFYGKVSYLKILLVAIGYYFITRKMKLVKCPKIFLRLGDISYSFYLLHYFVLKFIARICGINNENIIYCAMNLIIAFTLTCFCSYISYELIEKKFSGMLKEKLIVRKEVTE